MIDSLKEGIRSRSSPGNGLVTREMIHARAAELVLMDGRVSSETTMSDFAQAKRELTGEMDPGSASTRS